MKSVRKLYPHLDLKKWSLVFAVGVGLTIAGIISQMCIRDRFCTYHG